MAVSLIQMVENFANDFVLSNKAYHAQGPPTLTFQRVDLIGDGFILHLLQRVWSKSGYLPVDVVSFYGLLMLVERCRTDQRATDLGRCTCERG